MKQHDWQLGISLFLAWLMISACSPYGGKGGKASGLEGSLDDLDQELGQRSKSSGGGSKELGSFPPKGSDLPGNAKDLSIGYAKSGAKMSETARQTEDPTLAKALAATGNLLSQMGRAYGSLAQIPPSGLSDLANWIKSREALNTEIERTARLAAEAELTTLAETLDRISKQKDVFWLYSFKYGYWKNAFVVDFSNAAQVLAQDGYQVGGRAFSVYSEAMSFANGETADLELVLCYAADSRTAGVFSFFLSDRDENCGGGEELWTFGFTASEQTAYSLDLSLYRSRFYDGANYHSEFLIAGYPNYARSLGWYDDYWLGFPTP